MKRNILLVLTIILAKNAIANEFFLGGSYDFYRKSANKINGTKKVEQGFKLRAEWLPLESNNLKMGLGIAHGFDFKQKADNVKRKIGKTTPVYVVIKPEWNIDRSWKVYNKYRVGWSFNSGEHTERYGTDIISSNFKSGPYVGIEVGAEWKNFSLGFAYDINYIPKNHNVKYSNKSSGIHQIGVVVGYAFGKEKSNKPVLLNTSENIVEEVYVKPVETKSEVDGEIKNEKNIIKFELDKPFSSDNIEEERLENRKEEVDFKGWFNHDEEINK